ncbi:hypothetical protein [Lysobacter humi (ex Lee et al. 2017)]
MDFIALLPLLLAPLAVAISISTTIVGRRRVNEALRTTFHALRFDTPAGVVGGDALRVVKIFRQGLPFAYDDVFTIPVGPRQISDSFWYCIGPGPSYFLAIPMVEVGFGKAKVDWVVRPLSLERMRAALVDFPDVLALEA